MGPRGRVGQGGRGAALTRTAMRRVGDGEASGQRSSSVGRELQWPVVMEV
jgi:hypothetical protein